MSKQLCIKILVLCSRIFLRTCGIGLIFFYFTLAGCVSYSFYFDVMPYYAANNKTITQIIAFTFFSLAFFGSVYNYLFAAFSSPGYTSEHHITLRNDIDDPESVLTCETCRLPKPLNAHHCSFCNKCVINLDHHCPWINNCIGYNNLRYFLLFLFYTLCAILIYSACVTPMLIYGEQPFENYPVVFILSVVLSYAVGLLLVAFCAWSWYLALTDQQFIDVLKSRNSDYEQAGAKNIIWEVKYLRLRFLNIFGTTNFVRAFLPQWGRLKLDSMHYDPESAELMMYE